MLPIPVSERISKGYALVWLRFLREIAISKVVNNEKEWNGSNAIRLGRLAPAPRYKVTQQLAAVFADIGVPDEFHNSAKGQFQDEIDAIFEGPK